MRIRPWPLVILALLQLLSPFATVLFNSYALGVKPGYVIGWIFDNPPLQVFETLLLMPIAGIAIYQMKRWGYFVFFLAMIWGLVSNLRTLQSTSGAYSAWVVVLLFAAPMLLVLYFMLPSVRRTYMDPSVRWWEAKRRFLLEIPLAVETASGTSIPLAKIGNISEGGLAFSAPEGKELPQGEKVKLYFKVLSAEYSIQGIVMYNARHPQGEHVYGIRFLHQGNSLKRYSELMKGLELIGIPHRDQDIDKPWLVGMRDWASTALRTGKGLVPEVRSNRKTG